MINSQAWQCLDSVNTASLQGMLADEKREQAMRQLLLTAVAQIGVPINECAQRDWVAPLLQFVPGLGPRKAHSVIKVCRPATTMPPAPVPLSACAACTLSAHRQARAAPCLWSLETCVHGKAWHVVPVMMLFPAGDQKHSGAKRCPQSHPRADDRVARRAAHRRPG